MKIILNSCSIELIKGDITGLEVDAIVNAANSELQLGLGVAGAIFKKGGKEIQDECNQILSQKGGIPVGEAVCTTAGNLKAKYVIHAVGPYGSDSNRELLLKNAIISSLSIAKEKNLSSIAIPAISTGIYGYPIDEAAKVILLACIKFIKKQNELKHIIICLYDSDSYDIFQKKLQELSEIK